MELREIIGLIGTTYDRTAGLQTEAQQALRGAGKSFRDWVPVGYVPKGSGGQGGAATVPWIAVFNPDETDSAQHGMYLVYLFAEDHKHVYLSLNQGVTDLVKKLTQAVARPQLQAQAAAIREAFESADAVGLLDVIDLNTTVALAVNYEFGNIVSLVYDAANLPAEDAMRADLERMVRLYDVAIDLRANLRLSEDDVIVTTTPKPKSRKLRAAEFKPKSSSEYTQRTKEQEITKSRLHELLVKEYGKALLDSGFTVATNVHPRDMTAERNGEHWLIEAKTVYSGNGVSAARDAVGQLTAYKFFEYDDGFNINLLALFNESIGPWCVAYLDSLGIAAVWRDKGKWIGNGLALAANLAETA